jgi:hypothetical protein
MLPSEVKKIASRILASGYDISTGYIRSEVESVTSIIETGRANPNEIPVNVDIQLPFVPEEFLDDYKKGLATILSKKVPRKNI